MPNSIRSNVMRLLVFTLPILVFAGTAGAGHPMDRTAGSGTSLISGLHGRLLGVDADLACRRAASARLRKVKLEGPVSMSH